MYLKMIWMIRFRTMYKLIKIQMTVKWKGRSHWGPTASKLRDSLHVSRRCLEACNMQQRASSVHTCWVACPTYTTATQRQSCQLDTENRLGYKAAQNAGIYLAGLGARNWRPPPWSPSCCCPWWGQQYGQTGCPSFSQRAQGHFRLACKHSVAVL